MLTAVSVPLPVGLVGTGGLMLGRAGILDIHTSLRKSEKLSLRL